MNDEAKAGSIDEQARRQFETGLRRDATVDIAEFLPQADDSRYLATLEELVIIDLEFRWNEAEPPTPDDTHQAGPFVERYLERFPDLNRDDIIVRLLAEECWVRRQCGDPPTRGEYRGRFPSVALPAELNDLLLDSAGSMHPALENADRFEMLEEHARGGMGVVLRARDRRFDREVAVKQLTSELKHSSESRQRFVSEANIAARLEHPGIVPVYDFGVDADGAPFYAMKMIRGKTLTDAIEEYHQSPSNSRTGRLAALRLLQTLVAVAQTVAFAHSRGVIHRDVKPDNIVIGDYGETVLLDWGLAKSAGGPAQSNIEQQLDGSGDELSGGAAETDVAETDVAETDVAETDVAETDVAETDVAETDVAETTAGGTPADSVSEQGSESSSDVGECPALTREGALLGTPMYMAPEQALGRVDELDARTDVYALGAVLYQILTGRPPFAGQTVSELIRRITSEEPRPPRTLEPAAPRQLQAICLKALQKERADRYQSVDQLIQDLEAFEADEPVAALPEPLWWKAARWVKRHRTFVTVAAISLLLIAAGAVMGFIQWDRARQQRLRHLAEKRTAAETAEAAARQAILDGRFELARDQLEHAIETIHEDQQLSKTREQLEALREPLVRLIRFRLLADRAEQVAFFDRDRDAMVLMERAFDQVNAFQHWDWWDHLTPLEISARDLDRLRQDVYRLQLLLTAMRLKLAIVDSMSVTGFLQGLTGKNENARQLYQMARQSAEAADRFRRADATRIAIQFCRYQLGESKDIPDVSSFNPRNEADNYMIGLCLLYAHVYSDSPLAKSLLQIAKLKSPLATSRVMLTNASLFEPEYYWNAVWYGWATETEEDFTTAMVAYTRCVALRPEYSFSYVNRAEALIKMANKTTLSPALRSKTPRWLRLMRRALRDLQRAVDLDPGDPAVRWMQSFCYHNIPDQYPMEIQAQLEAVQLEPPLDEVSDELRRDNVKSSFKNSLNNGRIIREAVPESPSAWLLSALCSLRLNELEDAQKSASKALALQPSDAIGHTIQGEIHLAQGRKEEAGEAFRSAIELKRSSFLAQWGLARLAKDDATALDAYRTAAELARNDWQRAVALRGSAVALIRLKRGEEAYRLLKEARDVRPTLEMKTIVQAVRAAGQEQLADRLEAWNHRVAPAGPLNPTVGTRAPLLNGGFELGLERHWGQSSSNSKLRGIWINFNGCRSQAELTQVEKSSGQQALRIQNSTPEGKNVFGVTQQKLPILRNATYRVSLMAKTRALGPKSFNVVVSSNKNRVIKLESGTHDWKRYSGSFSLDADEAIVRLRMRSTGTVWIDDLSIELAELPKPSKPGPAKLEPVKPGASKPEPVKPGASKGDTVRKDGFFDNTRGKYIFFWELLSKKRRSGDSRFEASVIRI